MERIQELFFNPSLLSDDAFLSVEDVATLFQTSDSTLRRWERESSDFPKRTNMPGGKFYAVSALRQYFKDKSRQALKDYQADTKLARVKSRDDNKTPIPRSGRVSRGRLLAQAFLSN